MFSNLIEYENRKYYMEHLCVYINIFAEKNKHVKIYVFKSKVYSKYSD